MTVILVKRESFIQTKRIMSKQSTCQPFYMFVAFFSAKFSLWQSLFFLKKKPITCESIKICACTFWRIKKNKPRIIYSHALLMLIPLLLIYPHIILHMWCVCVIRVFLLCLKLLGQIDFFWCLFWYIFCTVY